MAYVGEIRLMAFKVVPQGWLACDGQELQSAQYSQLAQLLGNTYGGTSSTFKLPDLRGRVPLGKNDAHPLGKSGGEEGVSLVGFLHPHSHRLYACPTEGKVSSPKGHMLADMPNTDKMPYSPIKPETPARVLHPSAVSFAGGSGRHNNMQPSLVVNFCIAYSGVDPRPTGQE